MGSVPFLSIPIPLNSIWLIPNPPEIFNSRFFPDFLPWVGTPSTYLEYLLRVVYIPSKIVMEEIFLN